MSESKESLIKLAKDGLWEQNVALTQMIGLCPLMAVTTSGTNGLGMGIATTVVLVISNMLVASIRKTVSAAVRIPVFIVLIASLVTVVDMAMNAWMHDLYKVLGLFIALIIVNCAILGRAEAFASRNDVLSSVVDGVAMGTGFTLVLTLMGLIREFLGSGTLFAQASLMFGSTFSFLESYPLSEHHGMLLMILPPGGFAVLGFLLAGKQALNSYIARRHLRREKREKTPPPVEDGLIPSHG